MHICDWSSDVCSSDLRQGGVPPEWKGELEADYNRFANNIFLGADFDYDEWGYMQWIWKATHNADFFGTPAAGKTTVTRGTTTQMYKNGKIVRCRTHWNFREFAMQLGVIPAPDEAWRNNPGLNQRSEEHTSELQSLMRISYAVF